MKPSPDQLALDYEGSFAERTGAFRAALDAIDPAPLAVSANKWDRVCRLLRAVFVFSCGEWDRYAQIDPERLQESAELSRRQVSEARVAAVAAGLLAAERHYPNRGEHRKPDKLWVVRERFDELVAAGRARQAIANGGKKPLGATGRNRVSTVSQPGAHKETLSLPVSQSSGRRSTKDFESSEKNDRHERAPIGPPDAAAALRFGRAIGPPRSAADLELAWKLVALAPRLGEAWLAEIVAAVREIGPANPWAFAWTVACDGTHQRPGPGRRTLGRLLARVAPPPPGWHKQRADLSERLCVAADG